LRDQVHNHINMFFPKTNVTKSLSSLTMTVFVVISGFGMCEFRFWHFLLHDPNSEFVGNHGSCFDKFEHPGFSLGPTPKRPIVVALPRDVTVCPPVLIEADDPKNPNLGYPMTSKSCNIVPGRANAQISIKNMGRRNDGSIYRKAC